MYFKDFDTWNGIKRHLNGEEKILRIRAGEIRWTSLGVNIGSEIDGKGGSFTRPSLILHVIGSHLALVLPMSTKIKESTGYFTFGWNGNTTALCLHQIRVISQKRILSRKGRVSEEKFNFVKSKVREFYSL